jgi:hypothetical protein
MRLHEAASARQTSAPRYKNAAFKLPSTPWEVCSMLRIISFGRFDRDAVYPVDYVAHRLFHSVNNPQENCWYEAASSSTEDGTYVYRVFAVDDPSRVYEYHTPSRAWQHVIMDIKATQRRLGLPLRKEASVSGPEMFGWTVPVVADCLTFLRAQGSKASLPVSK